MLLDVCLGLYIYEPNCTDVINIQYIVFSPQASRSQAMIFTTDLSIIHHSSYTKISLLLCILSNDHAVLCNMGSFIKVALQRAIFTVYDYFSKYGVYVNNHTVIR